MSRFSLLLAAAGLAVFQGGAWAMGSGNDSDGLNDSDLRCLAVSAVAANNPDQNARVHATISALYWIGRLEGRNPNYDLENALVATASHMTDAEFASETTRCSLLIKARGQSLVEMGQRISAREANHGQ